MENKSKLIGQAYVSIIEDSNGEVTFQYGYDLDKKKVTHQDIAMLLSFLTKIKNKAEQDFSDRLDVSEKKFEVTKE